MREVEKDTITELVNVYDAFIRNIRHNHELRKMKYGADMMIIYDVDAVVCRDMEGFLLEEISFVSKCGGDLEDIDGFLTDPQLPLREKGQMIISALERKRI